MRTIVAILVAVLCPAVANEAFARLTARGQGDAAIVLNWAAFPTADAIAVERSSNGGDWRDVASLAGTATAYVDAGLPPGSLRTYRLRVSDGGALLGYSNLAWAGTGVPVGATSATERTYAHRLPTGGIRIAWEHRFSDAVSFRLERRVGAGGWSAAGLAPASATAAVIEDPDRTADLRVRVRPESAQGVGAWSEAVAGLAAPPIVGMVLSIPFKISPAIAPPSGLVATRLSPGTIRLRWTGTATAALRAIGDGDAWHMIQVATTGNETLVARSDHGGAERFALANSGGWTAPVTLPELARDASLPPAYDVAAARVGTGHAVTWKWQGSDATGFVIERIQSMGGSYAGEASASQRAFTVAGTGPYDRFRVWVRSAAGYGPVAEQPPPGLPATVAPKSLRTTALSYASVALAWTATPSTATCYVQRADPNGPWRDAAIAAGGAWTDSGAVPGKSFLYRVGATPLGPFSATLSVAVPVPDRAPAAVTRLLVTAASPSQINAAWEADRAATSFEISTSADGASWSAPAVLPEDARSWRITGLATGALRHIRVVARNAAGAAAAVSAKATTPATAQRPSLAVRVSPVGGWRRLVVTGTAADDDIFIAQSGQRITLSSAGSAISTADGPFADIRVLGDAGNDRLRVDASVSMRVSLHGGPGDDIIDAQGTGPQTVVAVGQGHDAVSGRSGAVVYWIDRDGIDRATVSAADEADQRVCRIVRFHQDASLDPTGQDLPEPSTFGSGGASLPEQPLWGDGPGPLDVQQGAVQDCPTTSHLQEWAAAGPDLLQRFAADLGDGTYAVAVAGGYARVDGTFNQGYLSRLPASGAVWALVFEKVLFVHGLELPAQAFRRRTSIRWSTVDAEDAYLQVAAAMQQRRSINIFSRSGALVTDFATGCPNQHAHSILAAFRAEDGAPRFVIRNPYGAFFERSSGFADWRQGLRNLTWRQIADHFESFSITARSDAPELAPSALSATTAAMAGGSVAIRLRGVDADGLPLAYAITRQPTRGSLQGSPPYLRYVAASSASGIDSFAFTVSNGSVASAPATISIAIAADPEALQSADIGQVKSIGASSSDNGGQTWTVTAGAGDIWGKADAFRFVGRPISGDAAIIAHIASHNTPAAWAKAGVMARDSRDPGSRQAALLITPGNGLVFQRRTRTGGDSASTSVAPGSPPQWVKLVRMGDAITAYRSVDGVQWIICGSATWPMDAALEMGLAVSSHHVSGVSTAIFESVQVFPLGGG